LLLLLLFYFGFLFGRKKKKRKNIFLKWKVLIFFFGQLLLWASSACTWEPGSLDRPAAGALFFYIFYFIFIWWKEQPFSNRPPAAPTLRLKRERETLFFYSLLFSEILRPSGT
jgi:hypothetical protein